MSIVGLYLLVPDKMPTNSDTVARRWLL